MSGIKRPRSAFLYFSQSVRPIILSMKPDAGFATIGKITGDAWRHLSNEEKAPFLAIAAQDKARYEAQVGEAI